MCREEQEVILIRRLLKKVSSPTDSVSKTSFQNMDHYCKSETKRKKVVKMMLIAVGLNQNQIGAQSKTILSEISHQ